MRIFLDDERPTPPGWVRAYWPEEVIALLEAGGVAEVSLDHDLGNDERGTGYDVVLWVEEAVATRGFVPPKLVVHSANPSARARMEQGIAKIERLVSRSGWARRHALHNTPMPKLREYNDVSDRNGVIALWRTVFGYETAHNEPSLAIEKKLQVNDHLFFVAEHHGDLVGTAMAGYDGHRGWLYAIAVHPQCRRSGLGSRLVRHAEQALASVGCMKINLQLLATNEATAAFYQSLGYAVEARISMGKVLQENVPPRTGA